MLTAELHNQGVMNENTLKNQGGGQVLKRVQSLLANPPDKEKKENLHLFYMLLKIFFF